MNLIKWINNLNELDAMIKYSEWIRWNESLNRMNWMWWINNQNELDENTYTGCPIKHHEDLMLKIVGEIYSQN